MLGKYGITHGSLVIDDSDKKRCKVTTRIFKAHKLKAKVSGGYINGQSIVLLLLVTPVITVPVGFAFYSILKFFSFDRDPLSWQDLAENRC
jgi:hypothetical protein